MTHKLHIAPGLTLPLESVTDTFAILAVRGVGKTHTASVMAEEMLKAGQPIVAYDPTGAWWGLKSSADGKRPAFPVVVFGGEHADVPLEETAGATIATTIVEKRIPAILDCLLMRKAARVRFMTEFCETLYHKNREPLHLFLDEAHTVAPQKPMPEAARLLGAVEDIVLQGRRRGLGLTAISQRPALLNTNIRSQCMTLVAMRIFGKHDRKAIDEWIECHGDQATAATMLTDLAGLPKGDAWVWNAAADLFKRVHFRERETFDSSATPKVGGKVVAPQRMAEVDLEKLGAAIKATVEKAKADDPKELRKRIAELEKQLRERPAEQKTVEVEKRVEVPVLKNGQLKRAESILDRVQAQGDRFLVEAAELRKLIAPAAQTRPHNLTRSSESSNRSQSAVPVKQSPVAKPVSVIRENIPASNGEPLPDGERKILTAAASYPSGVGRDQLSVLTGYKRSSRDAYVQRLRNRGYVELAGDQVVATVPGVDALGSSFEPLPTGVALQHYWLMRLPDGERKILEVLIGQHPEVVQRDALDEATGYKRSSRDAYLQRLKARRLVVFVGRGEVRTTDELF